MPPKGTETAVTPAKAGAHRSTGAPWTLWIPAFAGMTHTRGHSPDCRWLTTARAAFAACRCFRASPTSRMPRTRLTATTR